jgi:hypothetical protein
MRRFALSLLLSVTALSSASAWDTRVMQRLTEAQDRPVLDLDFTRMSTLDPRITFSRASPSTGISCVTGQLVTFAANQPAIGVCDERGQPLGLSVWVASNIVNQWARDLTQSQWVKAGVTAALSQAGVDGVANSASLVTATAPSGTVLQSVINASAINRILTADVKRVTGGGQVWMTQDGGKNWSEITAWINSAGWSRVPPQGLVQTTLNPSFGFKLSTSGDAIAVDYVNLENDQNSTLVAPSPRVLTTTTQNVIRNSDLPALSLAKVPGLDTDHFTIMYRVVTPIWYGILTQGAAKDIVQLDDGSDAGFAMLGYLQANSVPDPRNNDYVWLVYGGNTKVRCSYVPTATLNTLVQIYPRAFGVMAGGYDINSGIGNACNNATGIGTAPETKITQDAARPSHTLARLLIGQQTTLISAMNGYIQRLQIYNGRRTSGALMAMTARLNAGSPTVTPGKLQLEADGVLTYESGSPVQCNYGC